MKIFPPLSLLAIYPDPKSRIEISYAPHRRLFPRNVCCPRLSRNGGKVLRAKNAKVMIAPNSNEISQRPVRPCIAPLTRRLLSWLFFTWKETGRRRAYNKLFFAIVDLSGRGQALLFFSEIAPFKPSPWVSPRNYFGSFLFLQSTITFGQGIWASIVRK